MAEILVAFVFYPFKNGKNYYRMKSTQEGGTHLFQYDNELGFSLKPNVIHKNPSKPVENAPRRIMFGDVRTVPCAYRKEHPQTPRYTAFHSSRLEEMKKL